MDTNALKKLLQRVSKGELSVEEAMRWLAFLPYVDLGSVKVDTHRAIRCGFPEVILGEGKQPSDVKRAAAEMIKRGQEVLITRAGPELYDIIKEIAPDAKYHEQARAITVIRKKRPKSKGYVAVVTAGTADIPVAEEVRVTAESMGARTKTLYDVGVAGIHRVLDHVRIIQEARVAVVVAGMEGALASVVGGMVSIPVIAVPTSVGYGVSFGGLCPLLTMLNSCAGNVAVVNIDDGFGAGYIASLIVRGR